MCNCTVKCDRCKENILKSDLSYKDVGNDDEAMVICEVCHKERGGK